MKTDFPGLVCATCCVILAAGCSHRGTRTEYASGKPTLGAPKDASALMCWFVEDDGAGHNGYAVLDCGVDPPHPRGGGLFATLEEVRDAIQKQEVKNPYIERHYLGQLPKGWKVRSLTTNEVARLGLSTNCFW